MSSSLASTTPSAVSDPGFAPSGTCPSATRSSLSSYSSVGPGRARGGVPLVGGWSAGDEWGARGRGVSCRTGKGSVSGRRGGGDPPPRGHACRFRLAAVVLADAHVSGLGGRGLARDRGRLEARDLRLFARDTSRRSTRGHTPAVGRDDGQGRGRGSVGTGDKRRPTSVTLSCERLVSTRSRPGSFRPRAPPGTSLTGSGEGDAGGAAGGDTFQTPSPVQPPQSDGVPDEGYGRRTGGSGAGGLVVEGPCGPLLGHRYGREVGAPYPHPRPDGGGGTGSRGGKESERRRGECDRKVREQTFLQTDVPETPGRKKVWTDTVGPWTGGPETYGRWDRHGRWRG